MSVRTTEAGADPTALALARARIALGVVFLVRTTPLVNLLPVPLGHVRGALYGLPDAGLAFAWGGLVLPGEVRIALAVIRTVAAILFVLGIRARAAGFVAGVCGILALSQDPFGFIFTLYTLFLGTLIVATTDATSRLALVPDRARGAQSGALLVRIFIASIYAWSAFAKMQQEWLSGATLEALAQDALFTAPVASLLLAHRALRTAAAWMVLGMELVLPALLLPRRTRRVGVVLAALMHVVFEVTARPDVMGWVVGALLVSLVVPGRRASETDDA